MLGPRGCQVAWARPSRPDPSRLDDEVRARLARLRHPDDRARHATGVLLTDALVREHGGPDARVRRARGRAPVVEGAELYVSVAHAGALVAVAVTRIAPVGVDVEALAGAPDAGELAAGILARAERDAFARCCAGRDEAARRWALLTWWTRKEAVLKATGDGLAVEPRDVAVSAPDEPPRLLAFAGRPALPATCSIADVAPDAEHVGAVALLAGGPIAVEHVDGAALL
ncbi:hypothetical protein DSM104299_03987 [Baekduia alba]|uniref:4'-phosphopantetheinyl transferase family protein n=1 Tax=Baekduia alba TaxID=2997333 RepID=UPI00234069C5|nr:4'-phosphopantetheinyl transferase superfamily protein [Baekduia alba]WCB95244.1 hypothetical protein DSM104299_03987 [Baekduia alba]